MNNLRIRDKERIERVYNKMRKIGLDDGQLKVLEFELEKIIKEKNDLISAAVKYCL